MKSGLQSLCLGLTPRQLLMKVFHFRCVALGYQIRFLPPVRRGTTYLVSVVGVFPLVAALRRAWAVTAAIERVALLLAALLVGAAVSLPAAAGLAPLVLLPGGGAPPVTWSSVCSGGGDAARGDVTLGAALTLEPLTLLLAFLGGMVANFSNVDFRSLPQRNFLLSFPQTAPTVVTSKLG